MAVSAGGFCVLFLLIFFAEESPRFLVARGKQWEANQALSKMYLVNQQAPWTYCPLCLTRGEDGPAGQCEAWSLLLERKNRALLAFALALFGVLASTTVLLDTWGPGLYQDLLVPEAGELPTRILMLFNAGDLCGIIVSILVIDRIGRSGSFVIGFFVQGSLLAIITWLDVRDPIIYGLALVCGTLSSACRCFGWESAQMWSLEAFPTEVRAIAFSSCMAAMRCLSILSLKASAPYVNRLKAAESLRLISAGLILGGFLATLLPKETAMEPMTEGTHTPKRP